MKCGNCKQDHSTIQEVKDCYTLGKPGQIVEIFNPATEKQRSFLLSLSQERPKWARTKKVDADAILKMSKEQASELISEALTVKAEKDIRPALPEIDDGYYAIDIDGTVKFYRLSWSPRAHRTYVNVQASDDFYPVRDIDKIKEIFAAIKKQGIKESQKRYGQEIGRCGICNRTLTDALSIKIGIGPVCREKWGF